MTSFHDLYSRYARDVYRFAFYLTANPTLADDVTSETFVRVWTSPQPLRLATVKAYLLTIARNLCLMEARRTNRERELDEALPDARNLAADAEKKDELHRVLRSLQELPEIDRTALLMRAEQGLSYEEIASALRLPLATVKVRIHRARLKLAKYRTHGATAK